MQAGYTKALKPVTALLTIRFCISRPRGDPRLADEVLARRGEQRNEQGQGTVAGSLLVGAVRQRGSWLRRAVSRSKIKLEICMHAHPEHPEEVRPTIAGRVESNLAAAR